MAGQPGRPDELSQLPCDARDLACFVSRRVTSVGICGSDLHWWNESGIGDTQLGRPLVLGHEIAGVVAAGPRSGQPVALDPAIPCDSCGQCRCGQCRRGLQRYYVRGLISGALKG